MTDARETKHADDAVDKTVVLKIEAALASLDVPKVLEGKLVQYALERELDALVLRRLKGWWGVVIVLASLLLSLLGFFGWKQVSDFKEAAQKLMEDQTKAVERQQQALSELQKEIRDVSKGASDAKFKADDAGRAATDASNQATAVIGQLGSLVGASATLNKAAIDSIERTQKADDALSGAAGKHAEVVDQLKRMSSLTEQIEVRLDHGRKALGRVLVETVSLKSSQAVGPVRLPRGIGGAHVLEFPAQDIDPTGALQLTVDQHPYAIEVRDRELQPWVPVPGTDRKYCYRIDQTYGQKGNKVRDFVRLLFRTNESADPSCEG